MAFKNWLHNLFTQATRTDASPGETDSTAVVVAEASSEDTLVLEPAISPDTLPQPETSGVFATGWRTDVGKLRGHNEDGIFIFLGEQQSYEAIPPFGLFVLADGMGGHQAGEAASALASRTVAGFLLAQVYLPLLTGTERTATQPSLNAVMTQALTAANRAVSQTLPGSGTTLTCALALGMRLIIGHVGDSRAYLRRATGEVQQLTQDHSVVNKLVEIGQLTPEEAAVHPQRNMLYRAVGQDGALEVDVLTAALETGDILFMCSDGLWGLLAEELIWDTINAAPSLARAGEALVAAANAAGGTDNISVVLVKVQREVA